MKNPIKLNVYGAVDYNQYNQHVYNNIRQYKIYAQISSFELADGNRDFSKAVDIGLEYIFDEVVIQDSFQPLSNFNCVDFDGGDARLSASIKTTDKDNEYIFYPIEKSNIPAGKVILVPTFGTSDWDLFAKGERHKFTYVRFEWDGYTEGLFYYLWAIAIDKNNNPESNRSEFTTVDGGGLSRFNNSDFPIGLLFDGEIEFKKVANPDASVFDFTKGLVGSPNSTVPAYYELSGKDSLGVDLGRYFYYDISTLANASGNPSLRKNILVDAVNSKLTVLLAMFDLYPNVAEEYLFSIEDGATVYMSLTAQLSGNDVIIKYYPNQAQGGSISYTVPLSNFVQSGYVNKSAIGVTFSRIDGKALLSINGAVVGSLDVSGYDLANTFNGLKFKIGKNNNVIGKLFQLVTIPDYVDESNLNAYTKYMKYYFIESTSGRKPSTPFGLSASDIYTINDSTLPSDEISSILNKDGFKDQLIITP